MVTRASKKRHLILLNIPAQHQVELFDEVARISGADILVVYLNGNTTGRPWGVGKPNHPHQIRESGVGNPVFSVNTELLRLINHSTTASVVVGQYSSLSHQLAMATATRRAIPWALWVEPPGVKYFEVPNPVPEIVRPALRTVLLMQSKIFASEIWGIGKVAQRKLSERVGREVEWLPYASDLSRFGRGDATYTDAGRVRFVFNGRRSFRKGFDVLLRAFCKLDSLGVPRAAWRLHLLGSAKTQEFGVPDSISENVIDEGLIDVNEIAGWLRRFDVMVVPSRYDGWGMVVPEALGAGLTVLSTSETGAAVDVGDNGRWLRCLPPGDEDALASALAEVVDRRGSLASWGKEAERVAGRYDVKKIAPELVRRLEALSRKGR